MKIDKNKLDNLVREEQMRFEKSLQKQTIVEMFEHQEWRPTLVDILTNILLEKANNEELKKIRTSIDNLSNETLK